jgi:Sulfotransferase domain
VTGLNGALSSAPGPVSTSFPRPDGPISVVYLGGCGRSGSTLLDRIIGQVPGHMSAGELVHLWRRGLAANELCGCGQPFLRCPFWEKVGLEAFGGWDHIDPGHVLRLARRVDRNRFIPLMLLPRLWPPYRARLATYAAILERLYAGIARAGDGAVIVDSSKHASHAFLLRRVNGLDLHVVHLVRDSRGVAYSQSRRVKRPEVVGSVSYMQSLRPERSSAQWLFYNLLFHLLKATGTPTSFLRYEALVAEPREAVERILRRSGQQVGPTDLDFIQGARVSLKRNHTVAGNPMRFRRGELVVRADDRWRTAMRRRDRLVTSLLTWPLRMAYGYVGARWESRSSSRETMASAGTASAGAPGR